MAVPNDRRYLETHEWHKRDGNVVIIGITQIAADELTDITFVDLPKVGEKIEANKSFGEIESVKATSDLYSGVSGTVSAINAALNAEPGIVNRDPYEAGWLIKLTPSNVGELEKLLTAEDYLAKTGH
jgi:glycine cleavage system H protein